MKQSFVIDPRTGKKVDLIQTGKIEGFSSGDRVKLSIKCHDNLIGKLAVVLGFDQEDNIWIQVDDQSDACRIMKIAAYKYLIKINQ